MPYLLKTNYHKLKKYSIKYKSLICTNYKILNACSTSIHFLLFLLCFGSTLKKLKGINFLLDRYHFRWEKNKVSERTPLRRQYFGNLRHCAAGDNAIDSFAVSIWII